MDIQTFIVMTTDDYIFGFFDFLSISHISNLISIIIFFNIFFIFYNTTRTTTNIQEYPCSHNTYIRVIIPIIKL